MKSLSDLPDDLVEMILRLIGTREKHRLLASGDGRFAWRIHRRIDKFQFRMKEAALLLPSWSHLQELKLTYEFVTSNPFKIHRHQPSSGNHSSPSLPITSSSSSSSTISIVFPNLIVLKISWVSSVCLSDLGAQNCAIMFPRLKFLYLQRAQHNHINFTYLQAWPLLDTLEIDSRTGAIDDGIINHLPANLKCLKLPNILRYDSFTCYPLPQTLTQLEIDSLKYDYPILSILSSLHTLCVESLLTEQIFCIPLPLNLTNLTIRRESDEAEFTLERAIALLSSPSIKKLSIPFVWPLVFVSTDAAADFSIDIFSKLTRLDFEGTAAFQSFIATNLHKFVNLVELKMIRTENFRYYSHPILNHDGGVGDVEFGSTIAKNEASIGRTIFMMPPSLRHLTIEIPEGMFSENIFLSPADYNKNNLLDWRALRTLHIILNSTSNAAPTIDFAKQMTPYHTRSREGMERIIAYIPCVNNLETFSLTSKYRPGNRLTRTLDHDLFRKLMSPLRNVRDMTFHNIEFKNYDEEDNDGSTLAKCFMSKLPRTLKHLILSNSLGNFDDKNDRILTDCFNEMPRNLKTLSLCMFLGDASLCRIARILRSCPQKPLPFLRYFGISGIYDSYFTVEKGDAYGMDLLKQSRLENYHEARW